MHLLIGGLGFLALAPGCTSTNSQTYPTLDQTEIRVSWEMTRFRNAELWGRLSLGERRRGNAAYARFKRAFDEALTAANGNAQAPTPATLKALANETVLVLSTIQY